MDSERQFARPGQLARPDLPDDDLAGHVLRENVRLRLLLREIRVSRSPHRENTVAKLCVAFAVHQMMADTVVRPAIVDWADVESCEFSRMEEHWVREQLDLLSLLHPSSHQFNSTCDLLAQVVTHHLAHEEATDVVMVLSRYSQSDRHRMCQRLCRYEH